jgi:hypothetical protein
VTGTWLRHRGLCPGPCQGRRQRTKVSVEGLCLSTRVRTSKSDERSKIDVIKLCVCGGGCYVQLLKFQSKDLPDHVRLALLLPQ